MEKEVEIIIELKIEKEAEILAELEIEELTISSEDEEKVELETELIAYLVFEMKEEVTK